MTKKNGEFDLIIDPDCLQKEYLKDLYRYRELFYFLAWRDIVVRYKQTFLGVIWAIVRPLLTMVVFAFVFGKIANLAANQVNYPLFVLTGLLPWMLFANSLVDTSVSLVNNAHMISKIYFPRIILPISTIMVHLVDFLLVWPCFCSSSSLTAIFITSHSSVSPFLSASPFCFASEQLYGLQRFLSGIAIFALSSPLLFNLESLFLP